MTSSTPQATRLICTNLPPTLTTPLLRSHILSCPPHAPVLTDCKILLKPDGTSRRIAFVGFRETGEADRVKSWADGSWVNGTKGGSRIRVDWAKDTQDAPRPRKRVKLSPAPDATATKKQNNAGDKPKEKDEAARFAEFMAVMGPRKGRALEDFGEPQVVAPAPPVVEKKEEKVATEKKKPVVEKKVEEVVMEEEPVKKDEAVEDETISDMEYMARRMKRTLEVEEEDNAVDDIEAELVDGEGGEKEKMWDQDEEDDPTKKEAAAEEAQQEEPEDDAITQLKASPRLFIRNLGYSISEEELRALLSPYGEIAQIHIPLDILTKEQKGMAYATFASSESAIQAYEALDRRSFQGRLLHILPAIARNERAPREVQGGLKGERQEQRKADAGKAISWGTLFMNADAVMSSVADRLKIPKSALLDPSSDNAAVRVALAETHVINETKKYFEDQGVDLGSLSSLRGPRSATTILIKNIPYGTSETTLTNLFAAYGSVVRMLVPPAGTMAIVEMENGEEAKDAFRGLVYKKLGGSVLYLEKAPAGIWDGTAPKPKTPAPASTTTPAAAAGSTTTKPAAPIDPSEAQSTLFVKNLSFNTTTLSLTAAFSHFTDFVFARVQTKPDPKKPGQTLSMGFGFVGFRTSESATVAMRERQGFLLEGHQLEVKFAMRGKEEVGEKKGEKKKGSGTKLIVKNLPFEATKKDVRALFSAYGQLNSVRLPRKLDHHTRGFAFLDFVSHNDAKSAFDALEHTHLLGRHLVLQWAEEGVDEVEELRKRTGYSERKVGGKKGKFTMEDGKSAGAGKGVEEDDE